MAIPNIQKEENKIDSPEEFYEKLNTLYYQYQFNESVADDKYMADVVSLITSRDKQICQAQREICYDLVVNQELNIADILYAPDAI